MLLTILQILCITSLLALWFYIVLFIAKKTVGKDPKAWKMLLFFIISGPLGWAVLLIIAFWDLIDRDFPDYLRKKRK